MELKKGINNKHGGRTLLASILLSAPGPLVLGLGLMVGFSTTQIADFVRRTVELAATFLSWLVFRAVSDLPENHARRMLLEQRVNMAVGVAMLVSGIAMGFLAVVGYIYPTDKGNVIPALVIAALGALTNGILALNYSIANTKSPNDVLKAQGALYRTKTFVDIVVCAALILVLFVSGTVARVADLAGGLVVTVVLCANGIMLLVKKQSQGDEGV